MFGEQNFILVTCAEEKNYNIIYWGQKLYFLSNWKFNVDASFSRSRNKVGISVCIRDDQGQFILAKTECYSHILEVNTNEVLGLLSAKKWVKDLQLNSMMFELDSKHVVDNFNNNRIDESFFFVIL
jgi:ribonuclease HI